MAFDSIVTFDNAIKRSHQLYEVVMSSWGNRGLALPGVANSLLSPFFPRGIAGAAVAPTSDVGAFKLAWNLGQFVPAFFGDPTAQQNEVLVTIDKPFFGRLNGPVRLVATGDSMYDDEYFPDPLGGVLAPFGTALGTGVFIPPTLRAYLFLDTIPQGGVPKRVPIQLFNLANALLGVGVEVRIFFLNVFGRKRIRCYAFNAGGDASVRLTGVNGSFTGIFPVNRVREYPLVAATPVPSGTTVTIGGADGTRLVDEKWVGIYATRIAPGAGTIRISLIAEDL